jgi:hypothetical protein
VVFIKPGIGCRVRIQPGNVGNGFPGEVPLLHDQHLRRGIKMKYIIDHHERNHDKKEYHQDDRIDMMGSFHFKI